MEIEGKLNMPKDDIPVEIHIHHEVHKDCDQFIVTVIPTQSGVFLNKQGAKAYMNAVMFAVRDLAEHPEKYEEI